MQRRSMMLAGLSVAALLAPGNSGGQERLSPVAVTYTPTISFGMIGLGTGVTARLNVVNLVRTPPPISIAQIPCKVELDLYDNQGKIIKQKTVANLGYGQADFLDLLRSELATTATHVDISGAVKVGSSQSYFCSISATLEVFDNVTGTSSAILTGINSGPVPFLVTPLPVGAQPQ